jgi:hypothetical protein
MRPSQPVRHFFNWQPRLLTRIIQTRPSPGGERAAREIRELHAAAGHMAARINPQSLGSR